MPTGGNGSIVVLLIVVSMIVVLLISLWYIGYLYLSKGNVVNVSVAFFYEIQLIV